MIAHVTGDWFIDASQGFAFWSLVLMPVLVLGVYPWRLAVRLRREGKSVPPQSSRMGLFFWPLICGWIAATALLAALSILWSWHGGVVPKRQPGPLRADILVGFVLGGIIFPTAWWLMGSWSVRLKTGLARREFWRPALVLSMLLGLTICSWGICLTHARNMAKQSMNGANLGGIGKGLALYCATHGEYPGNLRQLVDAELVGPSCLISIFGSREDLPSTTSRPYAGPCDFDYLPRAREQGDLVWVWLDPRFNAIKVAYVLYGDGRFAELSPDRFAQELEQTRRWLAEHPEEPAPPKGKP